MAYWRVQHGISGDRAVRAPRYLFNYNIKRQLQGGVQSSKTVHQGPVNKNKLTIHTGILSKPAPPLPFPPAQIKHQSQAPLGPRVVPFRYICIRPQVHLMSRYVHLPYHPSCICLVNTNVTCSTFLFRHNFTVDAMMSLSLV